MIKKVCVLLFCIKNVAFASSVTSFDVQQEMRLSHELTQTTQGASDVENIEAFASILQKSLESKSDFYVLTITRVDPIRLGNLDVNVPLNERNLSEICSHLQQNFANYHEPIFVVFNEYFFSRKVLTKDEYNKIMLYIKQLSSEFRNFIIYANFLYNSEEKLTNFNQQLIEGYIYYKPEGQRFPDALIVKHNGDSLQHPPVVGNLLILNETSVIFHGEILVKYRKSTYCGEYGSDFAQECYYYYGFGSDVKVDGLSKQLNKIADLLTKYVYTDICYDVQAGVRKRIWQMFCATDLRYETTYTNFFKAIGTPSDPKDFKLHIIQSNSTDIHGPAARDFPDEQLTVLADPLSQRVFCKTYQEYRKRLGIDSQQYISDQDEEYLTRNGSYEAFKDYTKISHIHLKNAYGNDTIFCLFKI